jgi:redox-sensitive bicupin YhaK (pirin superfamily)
LRGEVDAHGSQLNAGDGAALADERELTIAAASASEVMLFDLA